MEREGTHDNFVSNWRIMAWPSGNVLRLVEGKRVVQGVMDIDPCEVKYLFNYCRALCKAVFDYYVGFEIGNNGTGEKRDERWW